MKRTLGDSLKMQSLPDDKQCEHFEPKGFPSPAECEGENPIGSPQKEHTTD